MNWLPHLFNLEVVQVSLPTDALTGTPAPLATTLQVSPRSRPLEVIELAEPLARATESKLVGPASLWQVPKFGIRHLLYRPAYKLRDLQAVRGVQSGSALLQ